ncbi:harmonin-like, partial [Amphibalanus amphitrite]|uniref:harmonin-like n=1 Tax=Amphibalanus amphitrite TaxID=1232801 RepID=UPI001C910B61
MVVYGTRTVQLPRRRDGSLGFSVRGGREHGTGLFVSHVVPGSDAQRHGLKVGDEVLQVNGLSVKKSTHKEVVSVIKNSNFVQLRVRDVGLLPVKDICKGPPGWPGVFVQSTKEVGLAREVGLRPGDQILQCNGVSFVDIDFAKAVYVLKLAQHLDLTIRRGAAAELFAARSSGYSSNNCTDCSGTESTNSSVTAGSCSSPPPPPAQPATTLTSGGSRINHTTGGATSERRRAVVDERKPINGVRSRPAAAALSEVAGDVTGSQLTIDRHRRWQDIEAEWAESEQEQRQELDQDRRGGG